MFDLATLIEIFLKTATAHHVTNLFLYAIAAVFVYSVYKAIRHRGRDFIDYAPNLMTTLGILGTFVGIVIGLLDFDTNQIDASIENLLEGLKTAFITSLAGMLAAILFKAIRSLGMFDARQDELAVDEATPEDVLRAIKEQSTLLGDLNQSISGGDDTSLVGQLKQLRLDMMDSFKQLSRTLDTHASERMEGMKQVAETLWEKMDAFAEMLSKSATEQVINALKEVIVDFNKNLTEQFGENFKALDASVKKLVEWQEKYRVELEQMQEQYAQGVQAITATEASVAHISKEASAIPEVMQNLKDVLEVNQHQLAELERHLDAFREMRDKAVEAVPEIQQQLDTTVSGFQEAAGKIQTAIIAGSEEFSTNAQRVNANLTETSDTLAKETLRIREQLEDGVTDLSAHMRTMVNTVSSEATSIAERLIETSTTLERKSAEVQEQLASTMQRMQERLESVLEEVFNTQSQALARAVEGINSEIERVVGSTGEAVNEQLRLIDQAMSQEVQRVMEEMGRALAAISGQFTSDYRSLVDRMNEVVQYGNQ